MTTQQSADEEVVILDDGRDVVVRPIRIEDMAELRHAIDSADPETLRRRFLGGRPPRTDAELRHLVDVDHVTREAFVALAPDGHGVGIARYERLPDPTCAEVAVAVDPEWRHVGLATQLLRRLMQIALRNGIHRVQAWYYASSVDVADLLRRAGTSSRRELANGLVSETIAVDATAIQDLPGFHRSRKGTRVPNRSKPPA